MEPYSSEASYIIRQDFLKFSSGTERPRHNVTDEQKMIARENRILKGLDGTRREMTIDDGTGSLGMDKCPIL